jgi:hypothetical protein
MFLLDGKPLGLDVQFTYNGIQYPANWLRLTSAEEKAAIGITEAPEPEVYDDRFYWGPGNPKDLAQLKSTWVSQTKATAGSMLSQTDWMIIRKAERDVAIPEAVATKRAAIVAEANRLEAAINASGTVEDLMAVVGNPQWPQDPEPGGV